MNGVIHGLESHDEEVQDVVKTEAAVENEATAAIPATAHQAQLADLVHLPNLQAHRQHHVVNVSTLKDQKNHESLQEKLSEQGVEVYLLSDVILHKVRKKVFKHFSCITDKLLLRSPTTAWEESSITNSNTEA